MTANAFFADTVVEEICGGAFPHCLAVYEENECGSKQGAEKAVSDVAGDDVVYMVCRVKDTEADIGNTDEHWQFGGERHGSELTVVFDRHGHDVDTTDDGEARRHNGTEMDLEPARVALLMHRVA
eukprot:CAMPEP_0197050056 /NCGR_PEP_ID=MMETSP1384-20130603/25050_1 /TAXON_ID=29189 /ORGANISM="Ammonia sp." /LENGTH=124 /DNA_ID=CAMNT_0042482417 /DNA_START=223 /DNA_END=598 /DNA_ORIENTATION=+